ncbi:MAG TPA: aminotransferase class IV [Solirubrobacterales bacterium]|nr:aminotransferase class IV [Solirubrobacterales bacterium]
MPAANAPDPEIAPHPDPRQGVFETLLVTAGRPVELEAHLARLAASLRALFAAAPPRETRHLVLERAAGLRLGRLRLGARPRRDGGLELEARGEEVEPSIVFPVAGRGAALVSLAVPGGLGAHKWSDRSLVERAEAGAPAGSLALLRDGDGTVLEASRANVFAVRGGTIVTPPADGRILPGVARAVAIEVARAAGLEVREEAIALAELTGVKEVFLTGSVRGVEPAGSLDGAELPPPGEVSRLLAAELRRRWFDGS